MSLDPEQNHKTSRSFSSIFSTVLFAGGLILAFLITLMSLWPDMEASLFNTGMAGTIIEKDLKTLRCPLFITPNEEAFISATFANPLDRPVTYNVRATFTEGFVTLMREVEDPVTLEPGEEQVVRWPIVAGDAAYDRVILSRVFFPRVPGVPGEQKSCGVLLLPIPGLTGNQLAWLLVSLSLLGIGFGGGWWYRQNRPLGGRSLEWIRALAILGSLILISMVLSMTGSWGFALALIILILLVLGGILEHFYFSRL